MKPSHLITLELPFLGDKKHHSVWIADGSKPDEFQTGKSDGISAAKPVSVKMRPAAATSPCSARSKLAISSS